MKPNTERLNHLIEVLHLVQDVQDAEGRKIFDMQDWLHGDFGVREAILTSPPEARLDQILHTCGTSACAVGHAALDPWFNDQGLGLDRNGRPYYTFVDESGFHSELGWDAVASFFGLDLDTTHDLFMEEFYREESECDEHGNPLVDVQPQEVIDRVKALLCSVV